MSSPNISFSQIPDGIRKPGKYFEENVSNALTGLTPAGNATVLLAQKTSAGSATALVPTKVFSEADAILYFGRGSIAHLAAKAALQANPNIDLTVLPLADNGSTKATGDFGVTGVNTTAGLINLWVGDQIVSTAVAVGDAAVTVCNNIKMGLRDIEPNIPVDIGVTGTNHVEFTARNAGTLGNEIAISVKASPTLAGTMCFGVTGMLGGATDPAYGDYGTPGTATAAIVGGGYNVIISTLNDATNLGKLKTMTDFVSGPMEQRPAVVIAGVTDRVDTYSALKTLAGTTLNHGRTSMGYVSYATDHLAKTESFKVAGAYGAVIVSQSDPAVPYDGLVLAGVAAPAVVDRFTRTTQEDCLHNGLAPLAVVPGEEVAIVRATTTYTLNAAGIPDPTLLDVNTYRTLDYVRDQVRTRLTLRFPRSKLSSRTAAKVRAEVLDVLYQLEQLEIVQNVKTYESGVIVETDSTDPTRLDIKIPTNIVVGLHVVAGVLDLILG
jgi:phage tail sheath gpL-like